MLFRVINNAPHISKLWLQYIVNKYISPGASLYKFRRTWKSGTYKILFHFLITKGILSQKLHDDTLSSLSNFFIGLNPRWPPRYHGMLIFDPYLTFFNTQMVYDYCRAQKVLQFEILSNDLASLLIKWRPKWLPRNLLK